MNQVEKASSTPSTTISNIMSTSLITIPSKSNMHEVARKMCEYRVSSILLTAQEKGPDDYDNNSGIIGIITFTDLARGICAKDLQGSKIAAESIMSPLLTISKGAEIEQATKIMIEKGIRHLAVKENQREGKIVGILSTTDLARYLKQKLIQNQKEYLGEELSIMDIFGKEFPEPLPSGNQDNEC
jgi:signal-transduction protein with cAMP-binding, CBS, and nucleotidyltransferase domain